MNKVELNSHGINKLIKYNVLSDKEMKAIGFSKNYYEGTDYEKYSPNWYFVKWIKFPMRLRRFEVTFNVHIPKDGSDIMIDILDEDFGQPYDYQYILEKEPEHEIANIVKEQVEEWMKYLQDNRVLSGHNYGDYI